MFNKKNAINEVVETNPDHVSIFKPLKTFVFEFDPKMGLSDEEFADAMKGFAIMAEYRKSADASL